MISSTITPLPPLLDPLSSQLIEKLPELPPHFFLPPLEDRPQNPIVEALVEPNSYSSPHWQEHEEEVDISTESSSDAEGEPQKAKAVVADDAADIWTAKGIYSQTHSPRNQNLSWDTLRPTFPKKATSTPFLSEQSNDVFDAARHLVQPRLDDPSLELRYVLPVELLDNLLINLVGNSSSLYIWDSKYEQLVSYGGRRDSKLVVIIEGLDGVTSTSVIQRFLNVGTLVRRLELLVTTLRRQHSSPTTHAFSHALFTILVHIRTSLSNRPPHPATHITALWLHYADTESVLSALALLCNRKNSPPYDPLPKSPAGLLSHIYEYLDQHIEHRSSRTIIALLAYILTITSKDYFATLGESLGLLEPSRPPWLRVVPNLNSSSRRVEDILPLDTMESNNGNASSTSDDLGKDDMPSFIPIELVEALPAARKSLRLLRAADPDHHLCTSAVVETCPWVWTSEEVERLWESREQPGLPEEEVVDNAEDTDASSDLCIGPSGEYQPELLAQFQLFDLEPGAHLPKAPSIPHTPSSTPSLLPFLTSFPDRLSPLTPKLQHLAQIVLKPLFTRTAILSSALLKLYLTSLQFETHLILLRSYMLFTLPSFKRRLVGALFSDTDELKSIGHVVRTQTGARVDVRDSRDEVDGAIGPCTWYGIGLGHGLAERDTWPPGGADLSFFLRTVIVDSLEERKDAYGVEDVENVWREAEFRLGFALRDLPVDNGMERWLNPMSIEALDFLYLDYRPPHRLDVVITPVILSKYQRIFTFLLRLFRGTSETVSRIIYRSTFKSTSPVLPYAPKAQEKLLSLRFQIQSFVTAFMTYVFDSVIGGNFDAYLQRISELRNKVAADDIVDHPEHKFTSIFALRDSHSELLDNILRGCLLRTLQRTAGDALLELLELILRLGVLVINLRRGTINEAVGAEDLSELYELFQTRMLCFVKTIQEMHVKEQGHDKPVFQGLTGHSHAGKSSHRPEGRSHMEDLLTRIDPTGWWRRKTGKQSKRAAV